MYDFRDPTPPWNHAGEARSMECSLMTVNESIEANSVALAPH